MSVPAQIIVLLALTHHFFDGISLQYIQQAQDAVVDEIDNLHEDIQHKLALANTLTEQELKDILTMFKQVLAPLQSGSDSLPHANTESGES